MTASPTIALIYPPTDAVTVMPSLGIAYLAGSLRKAGFSVQLYDLARRHLGLKGLFRKLSEDRPKYVGLSVSTPNFANALKVARMIGELPYRPTVLLGGPHVSAYPAEALEEFGADFVVLKEAEESLIHLLNALENQMDPTGVKGIFFKANGHTVRTDPAPLLENLDELPWPAWDLVEPHRYPPIPHQLFVRTLPVAPVITTRGCPFNCHFCATTYLFGKKIRKRSTEDVADEMKHLVEKYGIGEIHIEDDNHTLDRTHIESLCRELIERNWTIPWKFPNGIMVGTVDEPLLKLLKRAACYQISLGIETVNEETVLGKQIPLARVPEITRYAREIGLQTVGLFVVGLPNETDRMIRRTIHHSVRMGLDLAHFGIYVPLPGSSWGTQFLPEKSRFRDINFFSATQRPRKEAKRIKKLQRLAVLSFYLRPRSIFKILQLLKVRQIPGFLHTFRRYVFG